MGNDNDDRRTTRSRSAPKDKPPQEGQQNSEKTETKGDKPDNLSNQDEPGTKEDGQGNDSARRNEYRKLQERKKKEKEELKRLAQRRQEEEKEKAEKAKEREEAEKRKKEKEEEVRRKKEEVKRRKEELERQKEKDRLAAQPPQNEGKANTEDEDVDDEDEDDELLKHLDNAERYISDSWATVEIEDGQLEFTVHDQRTPTKYWFSFDRNTRYQTKNWGVEELQRDEDKILGIKKRDSGLMVLAHFFDHGVQRLCIHKSGTVEDK